jgi:hypothetical protein
MPPFLGSWVISIVEPRKESLTPAHFLRQMEEVNALTLDLFGKL